MRSGQARQPDESGAVLGRAAGANHDLWGMRSIERALSQLVSGSAEGLCPALARRPPSHTKAARYASSWRGGGPRRQPALSPATASAAGLAPSAVNDGGPFRSSTDGRLLAAYLRVRRPGLDCVKDVVGQGEVVGRIATVEVPHTGSTGIGSHVSPSTNGLLRTPETRRRGA